MLRVLCLLVLFASSARADGSVALLPLDAGAKLEVYGQPVASEIARALIAGEIDVVVVLPKMAVPETATLILDGKIAAGKGKAIELTIRLRDPKSTTILQTFQATSPSLETLDKTTSELAQKVLPVVRDKLAALATKPVEPVKPVPPPVRVDPPRAVISKPLLVGVAPGQHATESVEPLRVALVDAAPSWVLTNRRTPVTSDSAALDAKSAPKTVANSNADRAIAFEVLEYRRWSEQLVGTNGKVPMAKARVRVRIADAASVLFDRVVWTNTVIGDVGMSDEMQARRVAREVLTIVQPHARKVIGW